MGYTLSLSGLAANRLLTELRVNAPPGSVCVFCCRIVQEQCCVTVLEDNMCTTGINVAKDQGACDTLFTNTCETKTTKVCFYVNVHTAALFTEHK